MENNTIQNKIQKLLSLANNNPSSEEAQAALLKAQELMAKHNISIQEVGSVEKEANPITRQEVEGGQNCEWKRRLAKVIADNFRCTYYKAVGYGLGFIGHKEDVDIAIQLFNYTNSVLEKNMRKLRSKYRKEGISTNGISGDYCDGFIQGLKDKFKEQVDKNGWGLILVKDEAISDYIKNNGFKQTSKKGRTQTRSYNRHVYTQGYLDGNATTVQKCLD